MDNILFLESHIKGKRKRELFIVLSEAEDYLSKINRLSVSFYSFLAEKKNQKLLDEMLERASLSERNGLMSSIEGTEFVLRLTKDILSASRPSLN